MDVGKGHSWTYKGLRMAAGDGIEFLSKKL